MSLSNIAVRGTAKAALLLAKYAPPKSAIANTGVTLGGWGISRAAAATSVIDTRAKNRVFSMSILLPYCLDRGPRRQWGPPGAGQQNNARRAGPPGLHARAPASERSDRRKQTNDIRHALR